MKIKIELDTETAMVLAIIHHAYMGIASKNIGENPLIYSNAANATNEYTNALIKVIPLEELKRIKEKVKQ